MVDWLFIVHLPARALKLSKSVYPGLELKHLISHNGFVGSKVNFWDILCMHFGEKIDILVKLLTSSCLDPITLLYSPG